MVQAPVRHRSSAMWPGAHEGALRGLPFTFAGDCSSRWCFVPLDRRSSSSQLFARLTRLLSGGCKVLLRCTAQIVLHVCSGTGVTRTSLCVQHIAWPSGLVDSCRVRQHDCTKWPKAIIISNTRTIRSVSTRAQNAFFFLGYTRIVQTLTFDGLAGPP
jgi:hypothetical protein